jgi:hypothetical protein
MSIFINELLSMNVWTEVKVFFDFFLSREQIIIFVSVYFFVPFFPTCPLAFLQSFAVIAC